MTIFIRATPNKGNNKITELRAILQRESQNSQVYKDKISQQPENCENRNDPDLVQAWSEHLTIFGKRKVKLTFIGK